MLMVPLPRPLHSLCAVILALLALALRPAMEGTNSGLVSGDYDAGAATSVLTDLCNLGPRPAGSSAAATARRRLRKELDDIASAALASGATLEIEMVRSSAACPPEWSAAHRQLDLPAKLRPCFRPQQGELPQSVVA